MDCLGNLKTNRKNKYLFEKQLFFLSVYLDEPTLQYSHDQGLQVNIPSLKWSYFLDHLAWISFIHIVKLNLFGCVQLFIESILD